MSSISAVMFAAVIATPVHADGASSTCPRRVTSITRAGWIAVDYPARATASRLEIVSETPPTEAVEAPDDSVPGALSWRLDRRLRFFAVCKYKRSRSAWYRALAQKDQVCAKTLVGRTLTCR